jgi:hypothetical protein
MLALRHAMGESFRNGGDRGARARDRTVNAERGSPAPHKEQSTRSLRAEEHENRAIKFQMVQWSMLLGIGAASVVVGVVLMVRIAILDPTQDDQDAGRTAVRIGGVALLWLVAGLLLWQAGRARAELMRLLQTARDDERVYEARALLSTIGDDNADIRAGALAILATQLAGATEHVGLLSRLVDVEDDERRETGA